MAEEQKKKHRIAGQAYWELKSLWKKLEEGEKKLQAWREEKCEELKVYPDQVNWNTGAIFDPLAQIEDGKVVNAKVIGRMPMEMFKEHRQKEKANLELVAALEKYRDELAKRLNTWPDAIGLRDGTVDGDAYAAVDPDAAPQEAEKVSAAESEAVPIRT